MSIIKHISKAILFTFITLLSCSEKEAEIPTNKVKIEQEIICPKEDNTSLNRDVIIYGAKYCKSVAEQMLEEASKLNCKEVIELANKAIFNSQLSLESTDINDANFYFKKAESLIYKTVNLMVDCGKYNYNDELYKA